MKLLLALVSLLLTPGLALATFPVVAGTQTTVQASGATQSQLYNLPASVAAGDVLIGCARSNSGTHTWPGSWVELLDTGGATTGYLRASGGETTVTVTSNTNSKSVAVFYRLTGVHGTSAPEAASASGTSTTPDPPSLNPANWDAEDTLWLACGSLTDATADPPFTFSGIPASYTDSITVNNTGGGTQASMGSARRQLNASSEDPGTFTITASDLWEASIIAVRPAADAPATGQVRRRVN